MYQSAAVYDSLVEVYGRGNYAPFTRAVRRAGTEGVGLVRFAQPASSFPDPPTPDYTLAMNERGTGRMTFDIGTGRKEIPFRRGDLVLKAPGVPTHFAVDAPHQKAFVSLPVAFVERLARDTGTPCDAGGAVDFGRLHDGAFRCAPIARLLKLIWSEPMTDSPHARLFNDGAVLALAAALLRLAGAQAVAPAGAMTIAPVGAQVIARAVVPRASGALSAARLARVRDFVAANLGEAFGIAEMAEVANLSPYHFSRAFKQATGRTPRAFVTDRRVERAKELLARTDLPLAQVAQGCGFADQAHFTTVFSRQSGVTPGAFRRRPA